MYDNISGKKFRRTNIVAARRGNQIIAPLQYECSMNGMLFESWSEQNLIPELSENSVIVMDNASFHRKKRLHAIAEAHHMTLIFLPLYSPELNPIEKEWANLKRWLKYNLRQFDTLDNAISYYFKVEQLYPEFVSQKSDNPDKDKEIGDSTALKPVLSDFFQLHPTFSYSTLLGDAAFDSYDNYAMLRDESPTV